MATRNKHSQSKVAALSDAALLSRFESLMRTSHRQLAKVLAHLAEVDTRKLYLGKGYASMFAYCTERLHLSEGAAYKRIKAARMIRRFPTLLERIESGKLHLSAVSVLGPVLTEDNHVAALDMATHKSRREVEEIAVRYAPRTTVRPHLRRFPYRNPQPDGVDGSLSAPEDGTTTDTPTEAQPGEGTGSQPSGGPGAAAPGARCVNDSISPMNGEQFRLHVTVSRELRDKLTKAQQLSKPGSSMAQVIERALDVLINKLMKRRFAATQRPHTATPRASKPASRRGRHVPASVRREVVERDGLQCSFVSADGHRCSERSGLELHHHQPFARGGDHTADNISLMCRPHNGYLAERDYGSEHMQRCVENEKGKSTKTQPPTGESLPGTTEHGIAKLPDTETPQELDIPRATTERPTAEAPPEIDSPRALDQPCSVAAQGARGACSSGDPQPNHHASPSATSEETCTAPTAAARHSPGCPVE